MQHGGLKVLYILAQSSLQLQKKHFKERDKDDMIQNIRTIKKPCVPPGA